MQKWQVRTKKLAVWELTLACNLRCNHCGSAAGKPREGELGIDQKSEQSGRIPFAGVRGWGYYQLVSSKPTFLRVYGGWGQYQVRSSGWLFLCIGWASEDNTN